ncbi:tripartite motif-containing protein 2-like [Tigriopus californicus]|nr:tripartite motif-containing protein 2-like [Tigriopus californicus]
MVSSLLPEEHPSPTLDLIKASNESDRVPTLKELLKTFPNPIQGRSVHFLPATLIWSVPVEYPMGICVLADNRLLLTQSQANAVQLRDRASGRILATIGLPEGQTWKRPSDVVALADGRFGVRDDFGIRIFDDEGGFIMKVGDERLGRCYGLAADGKGHMLTLNTNAFGFPEKNVTAKGQTDLLYIDINTGSIVRQVELCDIIANAALSKCRFLHCRGSKIYVVDLGLDQVYVLDSLKTWVRKFGSSGKFFGQFADPAGLVTDRKGVTMVADSRNHRVQIFDRLRNFIGFVKFDVPIKRPSAIYLDYENEGQPVLYVLNLWGKTAAKYLISMP